MQVFYCLFLSVAVGDYQEGRTVMPLTGLTLPHWCVCPKPGFLTSYVVVLFFVFSELR